MRNLAYSACPRLLAIVAGSIRRVSIHPSFYPSFYLSHSGEGREEDNRRRDMRPPWARARIRHIPSFSRFSRCESSIASIPFAARQTLSYHYNRRDKTDGMFASGTLALRRLRGRGASCDGKNFSLLCVPSSKWHPPTIRGSFNF
jgi:hypothetical protein